MRSSVLLAARSGLAALVFSCLAVPAAAVPVLVSYTFTYQAPVDFDVGTVSGNLQFYSRIGGNAPVACGAPIALGPLVSFAPTSGSFIPTDPCLEDPAQDILFSFEGDLSVGTPPPKFFAFLDSDPFANPPPGPVLLGSLDVDLTGTLAGFDTVNHPDGILAGSWAITIAAQVLPEPASLPMVAFGVGALLLMRRRRAQG